MTTTILICDDDDDLRSSIASYLRREGFLTTEAEDGEDALARIERSQPDLVVTDLQMPNMDGMELLRRVRADFPGLPVLMLTGYGAVETAVEATRLGVSDYLTKPFDPRELSIAIGKVLANDRLEREVRYLRGQMATTYGQLLGSSPVMTRLFASLARLEDIDAPTVLISGESGTGKELIAHAIHQRGPRGSGPIVAVDCASLPESLVESELFGHERGSFTDARATKQGLFEVARGGTLFLDEVGELPLLMQARLLRALESRKFRRVGGVVDIKVDAGIIAATNRDLEAEVRAGRFREDLYFRLNVFKVEAPSLRSRRQDVPILVEHFLARFNNDFKRNVTSVTPEAMHRLQAYDWPGNVRELRNVIERMVILETGDRLTFDGLPAELRNGVRRPIDAPYVLPEQGIDLERFELSLLVQAMERTNGNQSAAARLLNITRYALRYRLAKAGLSVGPEG